MTRQEAIVPVRHLVCAFLLLALPVGAVTPHATLYVSNSGFNAPCGSSSTPCRDPNDAIAAANPGDTILLGPGGYQSQRPCGAKACGIVVDKPLTLISRDGAAATSIVAFDSDIGIDLVADGIQLGPREPGR